MKTKIWLGSLAVGASLLGSALDVNAQYVQNAVAIPLAPGCPAGESWTKNGARYECETPQPTCANGFASGPVWTGSSWSYSCNAPPAPPQPPQGSQGTGGGGGPTQSSLVSACATAITSGMSSKPWSGSVLPTLGGTNGEGWSAEGNTWQWGGAGTFAGSDGTYELYLNAYGAGTDGVYVGIDNHTAQVLDYGVCKINDSTGAVLLIDFEPAQESCSGCGGSSGQ